MSCNAFDSVHWFMSELASRVVAETGIPTDRFHIGKLILQSLKDAPDFVMQIDATTGQSETYASVLERSVKCAVAFQKRGLKTGDAIVILAPNHLDTAIPLYAALFLGLKVAALDIGLLTMELEGMFKVNQAKMIFCQNEKIPIIKTALANIGLESEIVSFNGGDGVESFSNFLKKSDEIDISQFRPADFDPEDTILLLTSSSGTTGLPKVIPLSHKNVALSFPYLWTCYSKFPTPTNLALIASPLHWLTAAFYFIFSPILRYTRLQTSTAFSQDHFIDIVNKYRPTYTALSANLMTTLIKPGAKATCDITCFETILMGGSKVPQQLIDQITSISPNTRVGARYAASEIGCLCFYDEFPPPGSLGRPTGLFESKLVDTETLEEIKKPHVNGELWLRGPSICKGYYNNPEATKEVFLEDGWFRTGDVFYRDEHYYFYFVDRLKLLLKYKSYQISPVEVESVIRQHPGVVDVAVVGIPDLECGDLLVACVVPRAGQEPTAQEIKDLVKETLSDSKQLRGGVVFLKELPLMVSTKIDRRKLNTIVLTAKRE